MAEEESRRRTLDWRRVQDEVAKLRKMQEDLLLAGVDDEDTELDEAEMREINNEINRKMDALLALMERYNLRTETPSRIARTTGSAPAQPLPLARSSPELGTSNTVPLPAIVVEGEHKVLPRGSLGTVSGARVVEVRGAAVAEEEEMKELEKKLHNNKQRLLGGRPLSPGPRKRITLTQLNFTGGAQERSGGRGVEKNEATVPERTKSDGEKGKQHSPSREVAIPILEGNGSGEGAVDVVTIKKWMTRKRDTRSLESEEILGLFVPSGRSRGATSSTSEGEEDGASFGRGKGMEWSGSGEVVGDQEDREAGVPLTRAKSYDSAQQAADEEDALGSKNSRLARNDSMLGIPQGRRRRRNTDGAALGSAGSTTSDDGGDQSGTTQSLRRRRSSLGNESPRGNGAEGDEEWHDMLHSLGVTVAATRRLVKKKAKERRERKERKRRDSEAGLQQQSEGFRKVESAREDQLEDKRWIVFVNRYSGGKLGQKVMNRFLELLPEDQVFSLIDDKGPERGFKRWLESPHYRLVVCGGDGTANWVLTALDKLTAELALTHKPPVGIIPLGTGNDLSRACGWGSSFTKCEKLLQMMRTMSQASSAMFDRWKVSVTLLDEEAPQMAKEADPDVSQRRRRADQSGGEGDQSSPEAETDHDDEQAEEQAEPSAGQQDDDRSEIGLEEQMLREGMRADEGEMEYVMNNYFSIGVDAEIVLRFHKMREHHKELFRHVLINKGWYYGMSAQTAKNERKHFKNFRDHIQVRVWRGDQEEVLHINDAKIKSIIVMNIPTYGGAKCWGKEDTLASNAYHLIHKRTSVVPYIAPSIGDGVLEIVGMRGVAHLGAIVTGVSDAIKLAQATRVEISTKQPFPAHVDGEPWLLRPCRITIELQNQSCLLMHPDRALS